VFYPPISKLDILKYNCLIIVLFFAAQNYEIFLCQAKKVWGVFLCIKNPSYLYTVKICTMKYSEFEDLISTDRMRKYITACGNDTRKAMKLYRLNLKI